MVMPLVQLVVLGYAFGGKIKNLEVGVVDQDHGVPAVKLREMCQAVAANARTFDTVAYTDQATAPARPAQRPDQRRAEHPAATSPAGAGRGRPARRADRGQHRPLRRRPRSQARFTELARRLQSAAAPPPRVSPAAHALRRRDLPYVPYIQYLLPGLDRPGHLRVGDDRRRHHLHRRQGARPARRLPGHADHASSS